MTKSISKLCLALSLWLFCYTAMAQTTQQYCKKAFDATYESKTPVGNIRMTSDGKGHMRIDNKVPNGEGTIIADFLNKEALTLVTLPIGKSARKRKLDENVFQTYEVSEMKRLNAKSIGTKIIENHPCHGFEYKLTSPGTQPIRQVWIGDDIGWLVQLNVLEPEGTSVTTLKTFSNKVPEASLFSMTPPSGYARM